jgi:hypothetical protein
LLLLLPKRSQLDKFLAAMDVSLLTHAFCCSDAELEEVRSAEGQEPQAAASTSGTDGAPLTGVAALCERKLGILRHDLQIYLIQPVKLTDGKVSWEQEGSGHGAGASRRVAVAVKNSGRSGRSCL